MQGHWFFKNGGEKETDDSKEIYINGKQRIKARNRVEKNTVFDFLHLLRKSFFFISHLLLLLFCTCA